MKCDHINCKRSAKIFIRSIGGRYCVECLKGIRDVMCRKDHSRKPFECCGD